MSFGWSANDFVSLAKLCWEIHNFCRTAPVELQGLFNRLEDIGLKLERLSMILEKSGLGSWEQAPALKKHLLDVRACLEPLRPVTRKAIPARFKVKGLARLALRQDQLRLIEKHLDVDERAIDEMKIDLILVCSLRNLYSTHNFQKPPFDRRTSKLTNGIGPLLDEEPPVPLTRSTFWHTSNIDGASTASLAVSSASKALHVAMWLRSLPGEAESDTINHTAHKSHVQNMHVSSDFVSDVASVAEKLELYSPAVDPTQSIEQLAEISERTVDFQWPPQSSYGGSKMSREMHRPAIISQSSCTSLEYELFEYSRGTNDKYNDNLHSSSLDGSWGSRSESLRESARISLTPSPDCLGSVSPAEPCPSHVSLEDVGKFHVRNFSRIFAGSNTDNESSNKDLVCLRGRSQVSLTKSPKTSRDCSFKLEILKDSVLLKVNLTEKRRPVPTVTAVSATLSPASRSATSRSQLLGPGICSQTPRAIQHCFQFGSRPIPHLLHPDVEGPDNEPAAPYTITFTQRQRISIDEESKGPCETVLLMYIFHKKEDQITLCEKIFGKTLLASLGTNKLIVEGQEISRMSAITLWISGAVCTKSVTFSANLATNGWSSPKDVELKIHGLWETKTTLPNSKSLAVLTELIPRDREESPASASIEKYSSYKSGSPFFSRASAPISPRWKKSGKLKCIIEFSRKRDKKWFMNHLG